MMRRFQAWQPEDPIDLAADVRQELCPPENEEGRNNQGKFPKCSAHIQIQNAKYLPCFAPVIYTFNSVWSLGNQYNL